MIAKMIAKRMLEGEEAAGTKIKIPQMMTDPSARTWRKGEEHESNHVHGKRHQDVGSTEGHPVVGLSPRSPHNQCSHPKITQHQKEIANDQIRYVGIEGESPCL